MTTRWIDTLPSLEVLNEVLATLARSGHISSRDATAYLVPADVLRQGIAEIESEHDACALYILFRLAALLYAVRGFCTIPGRMPPPVMDDSDLRAIGLCLATHPMLPDQCLAQLLEQYDNRGLAAAACTNPSLPLRLHALPLSLHQALVKHLSGDMVARLSTFSGTCIAHAAEDLLHGSCNATRFNAYSLPESFSSFGTLATKKLRDLDERLGGRHRLQEYRLTSQASAAVTMATIEEITTMLRPTTMERGDLSLLVKEVGLMHRLFSEVWYGARKRRPFPLPNFRVVELLGLPTEPPPSRRNAAVKVRSKGSSS